MTAVLLAFVDGSKQFVDDVHVHGVRHGMLQLASGEPGAGVGAAVVRVVPLVDLLFAETCDPVDDDGDESDDSAGSTWFLSSDADEG